MTVFLALGLSSAIYFCSLFWFFIEFISLFLLSSSWGLINFISTWTHRKCLIQGAKWSSRYHGDPKTNNKLLTCSPQAHTHISLLETSQMPLASPSAPGVFCPWRWSPQKTCKQRSLINGGPVATVNQEFSFQSTCFLNRQHRSMALRSIHPKRLHSLSHLERLPGVNRLGAGILPTLTALGSP